MTMRGSGSFHVRAPQPASRRTEIAALVHLAPSGQPYHASSIRRRAAFDVGRGPRFPAPISPINQRVLPRDEAVG